MIRVTDPIVRQAIKSIRGNPDDLQETLDEDREELWKYDGYNEHGQIIVRGAKTSYQVTVIKIMRQNFTVVRWVRPTDGKAIRYELDEQGGIITVENTELPEAVLQGMAGKPLMEVVGVPGGETMRVVTAVNSKAFVSDPLDLRIQIEPAVQMARNTA